MKIRKELAHLKRLLMVEIFDRFSEHDCDSFWEEGMSCVVCCINSLRKPLALLQYLRSKGALMKTLETENKLAELLGEKEFKLRIKEEVEVIRNTPKKKCFNCGKVVTLWMPYSAAALYVNVFKQGALRVECNSCGEKTLFSKEEFKFKNSKKVVNPLNLQYAINLARKFNYDTDNKFNFDSPEKYEITEEDEEQEGE